MERNIAENLLVCGWWIVPTTSRHPEIQKKCFHGTPQKKFQPTMTTPPFNIIHILRMGCASQGLLDFFAFVDLHESPTLPGRDGRVRSRSLHPQYIPNSINTVCVKIIMGQFFLQRYPPFFVDRRIASRIPRSEDGCVCGVRGASDHESHSVTMKLWARFTWTEVSSRFGKYWWGWCCW